MILVVDLIQKYGPDWTDSLLLPEIRYITNKCQGNPNTDKWAMKSMENPNHPFTDYTMFMKQVLSKEKKPFSPTPI